MQPVRRDGGTPARHPSATTVGRLHRLVAASDCLHRACHEHGMNCRRANGRTTPGRQMESMRDRSRWQSDASGTGRADTYIKLATQLFGGIATIANQAARRSAATCRPRLTTQSRGPVRPGTTRCSRTTPSSALGMPDYRSTNRPSTHTNRLRTLAGEIGAELVGGDLTAEQHSEAGISEQQRRVEGAQPDWPGIDRLAARSRDQASWTLVKKSVWLIGGDGWAYDIVGGVDHVPSSGAP